MIKNNNIQKKKEGYI